MFVTVARWMRTGDLQGFSSGTCPSGQRIRGRRQGGRKGAPKWAEWELKAPTLAGKVGLGKTFEAVAAYGVASAASSASLHLLLLNMRNCGLETNKEERLKPEKVISEAGIGFGLLSSGLTSHLEMFHNNPGISMS